ncbi:hypothetical protein GQ602_007018 [Ophiocordyceps camponoti-floridani]|uniref:Uncharacterized protein n=1 Tax=Ophiocordyceps camponoti-floridani TaxID=2030778 RepID=A0A8H4Q0K9_9HYPO|nr:hypothetical protein GQ602_007018 [Ophiocordyceps camponoti-floridani]
MLTRSGGGYKMPCKHQSHRKHHQGFRASKAKSSPSTYTLRCSASDADIRLRSPRLKENGPVNEFPGQYIDPVKLRRVLKNKYNGDYAVEMRYDVYKIYASHPLLAHEISWCY